MNQKPLLEEIEQLELELIEKKKKISELRKQLKGTAVSNYTFLGANNREISLLELFGEHSELIVIHNMGKSCSYCTMWADGFNSVYHHIVTKAAFVLTSPDGPDVQEDIVAERGWVFPVVSTIHNSFKEDLGFKKGEYYYPGVSVFTKDAEGRIYHHTKAPFGPGDEYNIVWSFFDLLPSGYEEYRPQKKINKLSSFQMTRNIAVQVKDYENAIRFYSDTLGFRLERIHPNESRLSMNGMTLFVENNPQNSKVFFEFAVDHIEEAKELLLRQGCMITKEYSETSMMIADPFGLFFHVFESK